MTPLRLTFPGSRGHTLSARLDQPAGPVRGYALFAHCFTCSKDTIATRSIAGRLASLGFGVLRFDFTGLGSSEGDFASTHFTSNVEDLIRAADYMRDHFEAPTVLIGHSLGGSAVLAAAHRIPEARAVATIGAPADIAHVLEHFQTRIEDIERDGVATVTLAGRQFPISRELVEDARGHALTDHVANLRKALLILHSPFDRVVGIDHATKLFVAAKHPKSFVSLDTADHLLTDRRDAEYIAEVIAAWASRYLPEEKPVEIWKSGILVYETGASKYQNAVIAGRHHLLADEPESVGGLDSGPTPYNYIAIALGACTTMTLRMYAEYKKLALGRVSVSVNHGKVPVEHCEDCGEVVKGRTGKIDRFERTITVEGPLDPAMREKLLEIANKCPVHKTLESGAAVVTKLAEIEEVEQA
jgi:putative redox protein